MVSGFPTGAYCSKASQTPMSFCAASSVSTCTRTREGMSSIVLLGHLVSVRRCWTPVNPLSIPTGKGKLAEKCCGERCIEVDWPCSTERHSGRDGYVPGEGQGRRRPPGTWRRTRASYPPTTEPHPPVAEAASTCGTAKRQAPPPLRHAHAFDRRKSTQAMDADVTELGPQGFPLSATGV